VPGSIDTISRLKPELPTHLKDEATFDLPKKAFLESLKTRERAIPFYMTKESQADLVTLDKNSCAAALAGIPYGIEFAALLS